MSAKHTPGPWTLHDERSWTVGSTDGSIDIRGGEDMWIAAVHGTHVSEKDDEINKANAHLIAAAPELLEVAEMWARWSNEHHLPADRRTTPPASVISSKTRDAIAKAHFGLPAISKAKGGAT